MWSGSSRCNFSSSFAFHLRSFSLDVFLFHSHRHHHPHGEQSKLLRFFYNFFPPHHPHGDDLWLNGTAQLNLIFSHWVHRMKTSGADCNSVFFPTSCHVAASHLSLGLFSLILAVLECNDCLTRSSLSPQLASSRCNESFLVKMELKRIRDARERNDAICSWLWWRRRRWCCNSTLINKHKLELLLD